MLVKYYSNRKSLSNQPKQLKTQHVKKRSNPHLLLVSNRLRGFQTHNQA